MTPDQLEWQRRLRTGQIAGALGGLLISPGLAKLPPLLFVANLAGLILCLGLLAFTLRPGKFHQPTGLPSVPTGHILINENSQDGLCLWGCVGTILLCTLPTCVQIPGIWLAVLGCLLLVSRRSTFRVFDPEERSLTRLVTWGGMQFRCQPQKLLALACALLSDSTSDRPSHYVPMLIFSDGKMDLVSRSFFRAHPEGPVPNEERQLALEPRPVIDILQAWGEDKGVPVLAEPVHDIGATLAKVILGGLNDLRLHSDWGESPVQPKSPEPPSVLPPE